MAFKVHIKTGNGLSRKALLNLRKCYAHQQVEFSRVRCETRRELEEKMEKKYGKQKASILTG